MIFSISVLLRDRIRRSDCLLHFNMLNATFNWTLQLFRLKIRTRMTGPSSEPAPEYAVKLWLFCNLQFQVFTISKFWISKLFNQSFGPNIFKNDFWAKSQLLVGVAQCGSLVAMFAFCGGSLAAGSSRRERTIFAQRGCASPQN